VITITLTWSGLQGVAGSTEAQAFAWQSCQPVLSDPQLPANFHGLPKYSNE
jgi:hypothetical protein